MTGKCDGLLAVSEQLLKKQFHNATENWTAHAVKEEEKESVEETKIVSLIVWRIDAIAFSSVMCSLHRELCSMLYHKSSSGRVVWKRVRCGEKGTALGCACLKLNGNKQYA